MDDLLARITIDPNICHGILTFKGTRLFVSDVLEMVADEMDWEAIIRECHDSIDREAIAEAIRLAGRALRARSAAGKPATAR